MQRPALQPPARLGRGRLAPPSSLVALLVIVLTVGLSWGLVTPPWQSPDEIAHFSFVQSMAESFTIPHTAGVPAVSSEFLAADAAVGASRGAFWPEPAPPDWQRADYDAYRAGARAAHASRTDGQGPSTATSNPPLYYLLASVPYLIDHGGTIFGRLDSIRAFGVLLLLVTTLAAWLLAGEVFGRRRLPQLGCAAAAGLLPMASFMSTVVNPDALLITLWTVTLWLGARVINRRAQPWDVIWVCAATAAAILTKATSYALVGPVLLAVLIGWLRRPASERLGAVLPIAAGGLVLVVPVLGWVAEASTLGGVGVTTVGSSAAHPFQISEFLSYVWQFYLPRLPFLTHLRTTPGLPVYDIFLRQATGTFGWLDVYLPNWIYTVSAAVLAALAVATVALLARLRDRRHVALLAFFALTLLALMVVLHVTEYRALIGGAGQFMQGRYLLPVVGLFGLVVGLVIARVPARIRPSACALALTAMLVLQMISLSAEVHAYLL